MGQTPRGRGAHDGQKLADQLLRVVGQASLGEQGELCADDGQLFQFFRVVDGVDSAVEMSLTRARDIDPAFNIGDEVGKSVRVSDWPWALVDWMADDPHG